MLVQCKQFKITVFPNLKIELLFEYTSKIFLFWDNFMREIWPVDMKDYYLKRGYFLLAFIFLNTCIESLFPFPKNLKSIVWLNTEWILPFTNLYQRLNASFDWICNGFSRFLISRSIFARGRPRGTRAQKCFDRLGNDQIHWISNQMMYSIVGKG